MIKIIKSGLETSIQDTPGRIAYRAWGVSTAGPLDVQSFIQANMLVGNCPNEAGLEIQFIGPEVEFLVDCVFSVCGADNEPKLNVEPVSLWTAHYAKAGDRLTFGFAKLGARTYLAVAGGIDVPKVMGSRATHVFSNLGGFEGRALKAGDIIKTGQMPEGAKDLVGQSLDEDLRPEFTNSWVVTVALGPHDDYLDTVDLDMFFSQSWKVSVKSNRIGYRLQGMNFQFSEKAYDKPIENGSDPTNLIDYGCPVGVINICGQMPVVLLADGPSSTGYISPFTVLTPELWKVGQSRPGDSITFKN